MSLMRSRYRELGLELVSLEENHSLQPKILPWWKKREMKIMIFYQLLLGIPRAIEECNNG
jgi:hypothetical protein